MTDKTTAHTLGGLENNALSPGLEQTSGDGTSQGSEAWMGDPNRAPWVSNSLLARLKEMRVAELRCRAAFTKPYMGEPADWLADVYKEAVELFERRLLAIKAHDLPPRLSPETPA